MEMMQRNAFIRYVRMRPTAGQPNRKAEKKDKNPMETMKNTDGLFVCVCVCAESYQRKEI